MFKSQKSGLMKRVKAKGEEPRVKRALKAELHREEYSPGGGTEVYRYYKAPVLISYCQGRVVGLD